MADRDVGEMFLNFMLGEEVRKCCGVDITLVRSTDPGDADWEKGRPKNWEHWERDMMGLVDSPYRAIQGLLWLKKLVYGDRHEETNPFR